MSFIYSYRYLVMKIRPFRLYLDSEGGDVAVGTGRILLQGHNIAATIGDLCVVPEPGQFGFRLGLQVACHQQLHSFLFDSWLCQEMRCFPLPVITFYF